MGCISFKLCCLIFSFLEVKLVSVSKSRHWLIWSPELKGRTPSFCPRTMIQMIIWGSQRICERNITFWWELKVFFLFSSCYFKVFAKLIQQEQVWRLAASALCYCFSVSSSSSIHKLILPDCAQPRGDIGLTGETTALIASQSVRFFREDELVLPEFIQYDKYLFLSFLWILMIAHKEKNSFYFSQMYNCASDMESNIHLLVYLYLSHQTE